MSKRPGQPKETKAKKAKRAEELEPWEEIAPKLKLLSKMEILSCLAENWKEDVRPWLARAAIHAHETAHPKDITGSNVQSPNESTIEVKSRMDEEEDSFLDPNEMDMSHFNENNYGRNGCQSGGSPNSKRKRSGVDTYAVKQQVIVDHSGEKGTYTGSLSKATGMPHGKGRLEYDAGRWYEGDWKQGRWTGRGKLSNENGDIYEGELQNDQKQGKGTMHFADGGKVFVGEYIKNQMVEGKMTYSDGSTYEGLWQGGMRHGLGKCNFVDGSIYEGQFREGEFHGHGKMTWSDGGWYEGYWWNGEIQGQGKEVRTDGSVRHEGMWSKGVPFGCRKNRG